MRCNLPEPIEGCREMAEGAGGAAGAAGGRVW